MPTKYGANVAPIEKVKWNEAIYGFDFSGPQVVKNKDVIPLFSQPEVPPVNIMINANKPILFAIGIVAKPTESIHLFRGSANLSNIDLISSPI